MSPDRRCARSAARRAASEPCCSMPTSSMFLRLHPQRAVGYGCRQDVKGCAGGVGIKDTHGFASACLRNSQFEVVVGADGSHFNPNHKIAPVPLEGGSDVGCAAAIDPPLRKALHLLPQAARHADLLQEARRAQQAQRVAVQPGCSRNRYVSSGRHVNISHATFQKGSSRNIQLICRMVLVDARMLCHEGYAKTRTASRLACGAGDEALKQLPELVVAHAALQHGHHSA